jgi:hypothetical protein
MYLVSKLRHSKAIVVAIVALYLFLPRIAHAAEGRQQQFRLGTAALPFGWSTAIAKLDTDEKLDFAIADRIGNGTNGYNYRLQLALSEADNQVFHFRSADSALKVSIVDLDDDADLDVVLTHALSGEIAGVWLNNGEGGFHQANTNEFAHARMKVNEEAAIASANAPEPLAALLVRKSVFDRAAGISFDTQIMPVAEGVHCAEITHAPGYSYRFITPRAPPSISLF